MIACLVPFDGTDGGVRATADVAGSVIVRTWDHSNPYGLTAANTRSLPGFPIPTGATSECAEAATVASGVLPNPATDPASADLAVWNFEINSAGAPTITMAGETSVFVPNVDPDQFTLYYQDIAGHLRMITTSESDWTLNVSDTGGDEANARKYAYTYNGTLPTDLIGDGDDVGTDSDATEGTVGGWTFTVTFSGEKAGHALIWDNILN